MANWQAWVAAAGGLIAAANYFAAGYYFDIAGGAIALVFGIWAAYAE